MAVVAAVLTGFTVGATPDDGAGVGITGVRVDGNRVDLTVGVADVPEGGTLPPSAFTVTAGGEPRPAEVAAVAPEDLAVAVVLEPAPGGGELRAVKDAARRLLRALPASARTAVAGGGSQEGVAGPLTADRTESLRALDDVVSDADAHAYDVLATGVRTLPDGDDVRPTVVFLGFGSGTVELPPPELLDVMRAGRVVVHVLGVFDDERGGAAARALAADGGTATAVSEIEDLAAVAARLGRLLAHQYEVGFDVPDDDGTEAEVTVDGLGSVPVPGAGEPPALEDTAASRDDGVPGGVLVAGAVALVAVAVVVLIVLRYRGRVLAGADRGGATT
jgi:hypothetical protein